jgi:hypothetical protein
VLDFSDNCTLSGKSLSRSPRDPRINLLKGRKDKAKKKKGRKRHSRKKNGQEKEKP